MGLTPSMSIFVWEQKALGLPLDVAHYALGSSEEPGEEFLQVQPGEIQGEAGPRILSGAYES
jgi:hypothetical protein